MASQVSHAADARLEPTFRVLLADDSPESQALVRCYLQAPLYHVEVVGNGEEAAALFQSKPFDLVLIDQQMPVMDGFAATRLIRTWESSHQHTPATILALTADASLEAQEQGQAAGCTGFLAKPISKERLFDALRTHCAPSPRRRITAQDNPSAGIAALIDEEVARRRPLFLDNRRQDVDRMQDAIERGDYETIRSMGHRIKGLAGSYGFPDIGQAGAQLEQAGKDHDRALIRRTIDQLAAILARAKQAV
ncbi:MAG: response regulator [Nitrospira sp. CR1.1]|jgi:CheY-like chemotaxis protein|nr:response regulator [Nitrospira sp. CR1.1]